MDYIVKLHNVSEKNNDKRTYRRNAGQVQCVSLAQAQMIAAAIDGSVFQSDPDTIHTTQATPMVRLRLPYDCGGSLTVRPGDLRYLMNEIVHAVGQYEDERRKSSNGAMQHCIDNREA